MKTPAPVMVRAQVEMMSAHILSHFEGFDEVIEQMVVEQLSEEKLYTQIADEVGKTLRLKIGMAIDKMIAEAVSNNKTLQAKLEARVNATVRKSLKNF